VIYVGRPVFSGGWNLEGHPLANPFRISSFRTVAQSVAQYEDWLEDQGDLLAYWLPRLRGRRLGCWCSPGSPCHARVLARRADAWDWSASAVKPFRILVTASRNLVDRIRVYEGLENTVAQVPLERRVIVMHGACRSGGDLFADEWARDHGPRVRPRAYEADWKGLGRRGGPVRNEWMVADHPDVCLAFILACASPDCRKGEPHGSHGAVHCADLAGAAGIQTFRYEPWKN
jgi:hypothetical protein